jgi:hypothetical protein
MKGGDWLSKNLRVSIEQDYLATGKPSKGVVEAYTKYIRGEYQSDVKLSDNPEIENIIKELKSMLKPDTKREGGALKEGTEIEMEHKDTIEKLASGKYSVEEGAKMIAQDHLDERVDYYEIVKQEGLEFGGKVVPHRKEFLGTYFGYDSEGKVIRSADEINEGDEAYLQGGVKLVRPSSIWKFRHIRSDKGIYDNIPDWDGEEKSRKYIDELKEDIKVNGIKEPVRLEFDDEGYAFLGEGNHRLVASLELEKEGYDILIPVTTHKYWRGVTNKTESPSRLFTQEKIDKAKELSDRLQYHFDYLSPHVSELELGGIIEGQLHSECNEPHGCGVKFEVGDSGRVIEAERDEAVIVSSAFNDNDHYTIVGTCSQIASALNVIGGGKNFDGGAKIESENGKQISTEVNSMKSEAKDTDVERRLESGSIIINRRSMADPTIYKAHGTARQIASAINSINGNGVVIENGGAIEKA